MEGERALITELPLVRRLAAERRDQYEVLLHYLQGEEKLDDATLDAYVERIAAPILAEIDCKACANCCRSLDVYVTPEDARRLADGLHIPLETIETVYVDHQSAAEQGEWGKLAQRPCAFLVGNLCGVYAHRPESCRAYPALTPDFRWTLADTLAGASICPIIFNVLERLLPLVEADLSAFCSQEGEEGIIG